MPKIVIGIHGLGNKPPKETLEKWWKLAIVDGLNNHHNPMTKFEFELVYWADILHPIPLNIKETDKANPYYLSEPYSSEQFTELNEVKTFRQKTIDYLEKYSDKILLNGAMSLKLPPFTELFIHRYLRDLEIYYSSSLINHNGTKRPVREAIIARLVEVLKKHKDKKIFLIAHSMGAIITHDALIDYVPDINIDTLVTIGSPLGQKYHIKKMQTEHISGSNDKLKVPDNICRYWYNLSDLEDQVAVNHNLAKLYKSDSKSVQIIDMIVENKFVSNATGNPHKSYGYLRTPEFTLIMFNFLIYKQTRILEWLRKKLKSFGISD